MSEQQQVETIDYVIKSEHREKTRDVLLQTIARKLGYMTPKQALSKRMINSAFAYLTGSPEIPWPFVHRNGSTPVAQLRHRLMVKLDVEVTKPFTDGRHFHVNELQAICAALDQNSDLRNTPHPE